ncbi:MAG: DUF1257 domain-containing protein [Chloroflexota bacterium]
MSKFVKINTELRDADIVMEALDDLSIPYEANQQYKHIYSGHKELVPVLVRKPGAHFGFRQKEDGLLEVIGDDMQMHGIQKTVESIQQRYAYRIVLRETEQAGFDLVEETVGADQVIRLTVRRWQ